MGVIDALIAGHAVVGSTSVILNGFLLFTIILVVHKNTRAYAILMGATALWDMIAALGCLSCMARVMMLEKHVIFITHGPCKLVSSTLCFLSFDLYITCSSATFFTTMTSFIARLIILRDGSIDKRKVLLLLVGCVLWHETALFVIFAISKISDEVAVEIAVRNVPEYSMEWTTVASQSVQSFAVIFFLVHICIFVFPVYISIWLLRVATVRSLKRKANKMSNLTFSNHERIVKILTLQSITPFISVCSIILFYLRQLTNWRSPLIETSSLYIMEVSTICSPIIVFAILPAYRKMIQRLFRFSIKTNDESEFTHAKDINHQRPVARVKNADRRC